MSSRDTRLIPLSQVPAFLEKLVVREKPYTPKTIRRWAKDGLRGRKLKTQSSLGYMATTERWLREFLQLPTAEPPIVISDKQPSSFTSRV